jgi:hypothetical protein
VFSAVSIGGGRLCQSRYPFGSIWSVLSHFRMELGLNFGYCAVKCKRMWSFVNQLKGRGIMP